MDVSGFDFGDLLVAMTETLAKDLESGALVEVPMAEYTFRFTEFDTQTTCIFSVDHQRDVSEEVLMDFAKEEFVMDLIVSETVIDKSETLDKHGNPKYPDCLKVQFTLEDGTVFVFDGIADEGAEDPGTDFTERIIPIISAQIELGTFVLMEKVEYED